MFVRTTILCAGLLAATYATAEESKERTTGLPPGGDWTFNLDAGVGAFGFNHSLFANPHADPSGNLSDNWLESYIKPGVSVDFATGGGTIFAKLSGVGARTFSAPPAIAGTDASSFDLEDAYVGWKSADLLGAGKDALEFTLGRAPYELGHGFLIWDGAGDGGSRGGYWSGARKAWEYAAIGKFKTEHNALEAFYLERDDLPEADSNNKLWGVNYEFSFGGNSTLGVTYLETQSDIALRDKMEVWDARAFVTPIPAVEGLTLELEYANEHNGSLLSSEAYTGQIAYKFQGSTMHPTISYRYAAFMGDDPKTSKSEAFDSLFPGFYDWGTWWQGEIAGEYFLSNSNLISQQVRFNLAPSDEFSGGLIVYRFDLDQPETFLTGATAKEVATEFDIYVDWSINSNFKASFVVVYADPRAALQQTVNRTESLSYGMVYLNYSY